MRKIFEVGRQDSPIDIKALGWGIPGIMEVHNDAVFFSRFAGPPRSNDATLWLSKFNIGPLAYSHLQVSNIQIFPADVDAIPCRLQGFVNGPPLEASKDRINESDDDDSSLIKETPESLPAGFLRSRVARIVAGLLILTLAIALVDSSFLYPNTPDPLFSILSFSSFILSLFLVHIGMSLILFNSAFKVFRIFFLGESPLG
jgi:hypothetical protein